MLREHVVFEQHVKIFDDLVDLVSVGLRECVNLDVCEEPFFDELDGFSAQRGAAVLDEFFCDFFGDGLAQQPDVREGQQVEDGLEREVELGDARVVDLERDAGVQLHDVEDEASLCVTRAYRARLR